MYKRVLYGIWDISSTGFYDSKSFNVSLLEIWGETNYFTLEILKKQAVRLTLFTTTKSLVELLNFFCFYKICQYCKITNNRITFFLRITSTNCT